MPEMIKAGDLKVGDKFRVEATVTEVGNYIIYTDRDVSVQHHVEVELIERAMPKFEPGGILRYCHDPVDHPHLYVDWIVLPEGRVVELKDPTNIFRYANDLDTSGLSLKLAPRHWTYFPPGTANDNGTRLG